MGLRLRHAVGTIMDDEGIVWTIYDDGTASYMGRLEEMSDLPDEGDQ